MSLTGGHWCTEYPESGRGGERKLSKHVDVAKEVDMAPYTSPHANRAEGKITP